MTGLAADPFNLIISGVGGQGNVLASLILGRYFVAQGYKVTIGETYGVSQRGGSVNSNLRISAQDQYSPIIPSGQAHLIVALEPLEALRMLGQYGQPRVDVLVNTRPVLPQAVLTGEREYPDLDLVLETIERYCSRLWTMDATRIALDLGNPILTNIVLLGGLEKSGVLPIDEQAMKEIFKGSLPGKSLPLNHEAYSRGRANLETRKLA